MSVLIGQIYGSVYMFTILHQIWPRLWTTDNGRSKFDGVFLEPNIDNYDTGDSLKTRIPCITISALEKLTNYLSTISERRWLVSS